MKHKSINNLINLSNNNLCPKMALFVHNPELINLKRVSHRKLNNLCKVLKNKMMQFLIYK